MPGDLYEFRDYHFGGDFDAYKNWWMGSIDTLRTHLDIVGVWFDSGEEPRIGGSAPMDLPHGSANVTWVIRWRDMGQREAAWDTLREDPAWLECVDRHPGFDLYLHMSVRFLEDGLSSPASS